MRHHAFRREFMMKLLDWGDLREKGISYSRQHLYKLIDDKKFPKPIKLGTWRVAFVEKEIDDWIKARIDERDTKPKRKRAA